MIYSKIKVADGNNITNSLRKMSNHCLQLADCKVKSAGAHLRAFVSHYLRRREQNSTHMYDLIPWHIGVERL